MLKNKYLDEFYTELVYDNYSKEYIESLDEENINKIIKVLEEYNCYFIEDIFANYINIFEMDDKILRKKLEYLKQEIGPNLMYVIGEDMTILDKIIEN